MQLESTGHKKWYI